MISKPLGAISPAALLRAAENLKAMAHPQRLRLVELLQPGPRSVSELVTETGLAQNVVSQHLGLLKARGIVSSARKGRLVYYAIAHPSALGLLSCIRGGLGSSNPRNPTP